MVLWSKIKSRFDRDGDGQLGLNDVKVGGQQAGAAIHRVLDTNGDGQLSVEDVEMKYAHILNKKVKKAGSLWSALWTQPVLWIGVVIVFASAFISYNYYSKQYDGLTGQAYGGGMALIALSGLFAFYYYNKLTWRHDFTEKIIAVAWIAGVAFFDIWAFAGSMSHSQNVNHNQGVAKASFVEDDISSVASMVERKREIRQLVTKANRKGGKKLPDGVLITPRAAVLVKTDLDLVGENYFCRAKKKWCQLKVYCPLRQNSRRCRKWSKLNSELALSIEYSNLSASLAGLKTETTSGEVTTNIDTHATTLSKMTGKTVAEEKERGPVLQGSILELLVMAILHLTTHYAIRKSSEKRDAEMALLQAENLAKKVQPEAALAVEGGDAVEERLRGQAQDRHHQRVQESRAAFASPAPTPVDPVLVAVPELVIVPEPVVILEPVAEPVAAPVAVAPPVVTPAVTPVTPVRMDLLYRWREEALVESMGGWMFLDAAYESYSAWAARNELVPLPSDGVDGFHAKVKETRLLVPVDHPDYGPGYGGMVERVVA